jgi:hypothetical protein
MGTRQLLAVPRFLLHGPATIDLSPGPLFSYLSPFTVWRLVIANDFNVNPILDLKDENGRARTNMIKLSFNGYFLPFTNR